MTVSILSPIHIFIFTIVLCPQRQRPPVPGPDAAAVQGRGYPGNQRPSSGDNFETTFDVDGGVETVTGAGPKDDIMGPAG